MATNPRLNSPFDPARCGPITPADIPTCPHCEGALTLFMPAPELLYAGPVAVCVSDECPYYVRSGPWSRQQMGGNLNPAAAALLRYRHVWVFADRKEMPVNAMITDNLASFFPMGSHIEACRSWDEALEYEAVRRGALVVFDEGWTLHA